MKHGFRPRLTSNHRHRWPHREQHAYMFEGRLMVSEAMWKQMCFTGSPQGIEGLGNGVPVCVSCALPFLVDGEPVSRRRRRRDEWQRRRKAREDFGRTMGKLESVLRWLEGSVEASLKIPRGMSSL